MALKVLVEIANFGSAQNEYLERILDEYGSMTQFELDVIVDHTDPFETQSRGNMRLLARRFPDLLTFGLPYVHRITFNKLKDSYDLFIYSENDMLVTEANLLALLSLNERLPEDYISGFLRYEVKNGQRLLIDANKSYPLVCEKARLINGEAWFVFENFHQGCSVLTRAQLARAIASGGFLVSPHTYQYYGVLECGASDPYLQCGFQKVLPTGDELDNLLIWHLPNKYVNLDGMWEDPGCHTLSSLRERIRYE